MAAERKCGNCTHFFRHSNYGKTGEGTCRIDPPKTVVVGEKLVSRQPLTKDNWLCSEWVANDSTNG